MKGPYERLKYDLRRVFECPRCHRRVRLPGNLTFIACNCDPQRPAWMKLVGEGGRWNSEDSSTETGE